MQLFAHDCDFNPRTREGCDGRCHLWPVLPEPISIHAPVKGATNRRKYKQGTPMISIHAPVKGATVWDQSVAEQLQTFQSTHP